MSERNASLGERGKIGAGLSLFPVNVSGEAVNMAASVSCGSLGKCVCVESSGSACLWMFVCTACWCMLSLGTCVCGGQRFLSSLWGSCAGAKCPAAHRCLFTHWFTELTAETHKHTRTLCIIPQESLLNTQHIRLTAWSNFSCYVC